MDEAEWYQGGPEDDFYSDWLAYEDELADGINSDPNFDTAPPNLLTEPDFKENLPYSAMFM